MHCREEVINEHIAPDSGYWLDFLYQIEYFNLSGRPRHVYRGVCQGSCRVSHFLSGLFILSLRVQIYRPDGCPIACAA